MTRVYDVLAQVFAHEGVTTCFGLLGDANMNFAARLGETGCRLITTRHEHAAVAAAMAWARKTGQTGVATVTCGPGLTQVLTALPAAVRARIPLVVLAGEAPLRAPWYNQAIDQAPFVRATGAAYVALHDVARMPGAIRDAFLQAQVERQPVVIGVPFDLAEGRWTGETDMPVPSRDLTPARPPMLPDPGQLDAAQAAIAGAQRIVVLGGLGVVASGAEAACIHLARALDAPLATTLPARGLFHDDPWCLGVAGGFSSNTARQVLAKADLVIAVGASLARHTSDAGKLWPKARVLHIDIAPAALSQGRVAAHYALRADALLGVAALVEQVAVRATEHRSRELARQIAEAPVAGTPTQPDDGLLDPRAVVPALNATIPKGWQFVNSSGHCSFWVAHMPGRPQAEFLTIREFGAIGNGTSFAMGVSVACPDQPTVLFDGDGSFLMHVQELETMVRNHMPILMVVFNDGAYGSEIHKLRAEGLSDTGAVHGRGDLAAVARGFGAAGHRVDRTDSLPGLISTFAADPRPTVLDIQISDTIVSPVIQRSHGA